MKQIGLFFIAYTAALLCAEAPLVQTELISTMMFEQLLGKKEKTAQDYQEISSYVYETPEAEKFVDIYAAQDPQLYTSLLALTEEKQDFQKLALYAEQAIEKGITEGYYYATHANLWQHTLGSTTIQTYLNKAAYEKNCKQDEAKLLLAYILNLQGRTHKALPLMKELDAKNISFASSMLGDHYVLHSRNYSDQVNTRKAYDCFTRALKGKVFPLDNSLNGCDSRTVACVALGSMWEANKVPQDARGAHENYLEKAYQYYKQASTSTGKTHMARLVWIGKIQDPAMSSADAVEVFKNEAQKYNLASFLYATILFEQEKPQEAIQILQKSDTDASPLAMMQLGIACYFGLGIDQDFASAKKIFDIINKMNFEIGIKDVYLAQSYIHFFGLGVDQNKQKALSLMNKVNDEASLSLIMVPANILFPAFDQAIAEYKEELAENEQALKNRQDALLAELSREKSSRQAQRGKKTPYKRTNLLPKKPAHPVATSSEPFLPAAMAQKPEFSAIGEPKDSHGTGMARQKMVAL